MFGADPLGHAQKPEEVIQVIGPALEGHVLEWITRRNSHYHGLQLAGCIYGSQKLIIAAVGMAPRADPSVAELVEGHPPDYGMSICLIMGQGGPDSGRAVPSAAIHSQE